MKRETISAMFHAYLKAIYTDPGALPLPSDQYRELRRCFYGSFAAALGAIMTVSENLPQKDAEQRLERYLVECRGFSETVKECDI